MNKRMLLPKLSIIGIKKNGATYFPYIAAGIFSVFVFFAFASILHNDIMNTLPHSQYIVGLMMIGLVLLGIILLPFLGYTNSFLIKRRKKELGLYSILGLEKKHIGIMMVWETLIIFGITVGGGILFGVVFSKLIFLVLLNLSGISVDTGFTFSFKAFKETFLFFLFAYGLNLIFNLIQVLRSNPNDLMKGAQRGDKEPKHLWLTALLGIILLSAGYYIANITEINSDIFLNSFGAIALVSIGTHYFFTGGVIALLKIMKKNKKFYYQKSNYVTISGMLYRMKKSASSLANICIFSTMTIITLLCTLSLWSGTRGILRYQHPFDMVLNFNEKEFNQYDALEEKIQEVSQDTKVTIKDKITFTYQKLHVTKNGNSFVKQNDSTNFSEDYAIWLIPLQDYNEMEHTSEELADNEVMIFAKASDFGYDSVVLGEEAFKVKKELKEVIFDKKAVRDNFGQNFYLIVKDPKIIDHMRTEFESFQGNDCIYTNRFRLEGNDNDKREFISQLARWCESKAGFNNVINGISDRESTVSINGGLLFIGIFFGIIFSMCLILIMYYKQITEGYDDRDNFKIMQNVGMSDQEVRDTIKRQILMVFFLPLLMAILHTIAAFQMTSNFLGVLYLFDIRLMVICGIIVLSFFVILYGLSYSLTSRTYYKIVKQMNND